MMIRVLLILAILLGGLVVPVAMPEPVQADPDTITLWPDGDIETHLSTSGCVNHYDCIDADDCNYTKYVYWDMDTEQFDKYSFQDFNATHKKINSITVHWNLWSFSTGSSQYCRAKVCIDGACSNYISGNILLEYLTGSVTWATNPLTGLAWTDSEIDDLWVSLYLKDQSSGGHPRSGCLYVVVDYDPATEPTVTTGTADNISYSGGQCWADFHGNITDTGGDNVTCRGLVWDTVSHDPLVSDNVTPPNGYSDNITHCIAGDWGTGVFSHTANLACCDTYYYRPFAGNSMGWDYGEEQTFNTMCDPDIDNKATSYIQATTARLNSLVIYDGEQPCDVRFCYGTSSGNCTDDALGCPTVSCNCTSYDTTTAWVLDTYTTGQTPYVDLTGLTTGTTYYYCVQIRNDMSCRCGGELSFTTETGVVPPSDFQGIPYHRLTPDLEIPVCSIGLSWVKESGSTNTLIRYKLGSYPTSLTDGILVYFDDLTSVIHNSESAMTLALHEGLTPGTTYYYRVWGESGGVYSADNVTLIITTLAESEGGDALPVPTTPTGWFSTPDETVWSAFPLYGVFNFFADSFEIPRPTFWYLLAIGLIVLAGAGIYRVSDKLLIATITVSFLLVIGSLMKLLPMWHVAPAIILAVAGIIVGERR